MAFLPNALAPISLYIEQLLLDPNNPRFSELGEELRPVPESRFADSGVQEITTRKMREPTFDVRDLRDTIRRLGFLPMDRIVVRRVETAASHKLGPYYVVVEGNRRVTAIKWLLELHKEGKESLSETELKNLNQIECLLLDDALAPDSARMILPGLRHISGIKEWRPYQKGKAIFGLRQTGMTPTEVAQSLGMSVIAANRAYRCFKALEQMKEDEEYGDLAEADLYSYFEEVLKKPDIKTWLGWDDNTERFENADTLRDFYSWITPDPDTKEAKLPMALHVRELAKIVKDPEAVAALQGPDGSLARAQARFEVDNPSDWQPKLMAAVSAVKSLTPDTLRSLDEETLTALRLLKERIDTALEDRKKLLS